MQICNLVIRRSEVLTDAPEDSQCHGPRNFSTLCTTTLLACQEFRNYALLPLHLIYISDRTVILTQKRTIKEKKNGCNTNKVHTIIKIAVFKYTKILVRL